MTLEKLWKKQNLIRRRQKITNLTFSSIVKKVTAGAGTVTETGLPINEKTNSFRNTKFGIDIAFLIKMCKMPSSKTKD